MLRLYIDASVPIYTGNHITQLESYKANLTSHKGKGWELKKAPIALPKAVTPPKLTTCTQRSMPWPTHGVPGTRNGMFK